MRASRRRFRRSRLPWGIQLRRSSGSTRTGKWRGFAEPKETETMPSSQLPSADSATSLDLSEGSVEGSLRRRFVEAARRAAIIGLVNAASSESELARRFIDELCEVFGAEQSCLLDGGDERRPARAVATVGLSRDDGRDLLKRPETLGAVEGHRALLLEGDDTLAIGARSAMVAPFHTEDGRPVVVIVARLHETPFNETDRAMLEAVTVAAGQALERIWAYEARNRSAKEQAALLRAAKSMGRSLEFGEVMNTLAEEVGRALDSDSVACSLGDEVDGYVMMGQTGLSDDLVGFRQPPGTGLG